MTYLSNDFVARRQAQQAADAAVAARVSAARVHLADARRDLAAAAARASARSNERRRVSSALAAAVARVLEDR